MSSRVLIVQYSSGLDGSTLSALSLARGLIEGGYEVRLVFASDGPAVQKFRQIGASVHILPHLSWLRRRPLVKFLFDLAREFRRRRQFVALIDQVQPSIVYVNTAVSLSAAIAAKATSLPCIWHIRELFHNVGGEMKAPAVCIPLARKCFQFFSNTVVVNSSAVGQNMIGNDYAAKVEIVPIGISDHFFSTADSLEATLVSSVIGNKKVIGFPGTLRPPKGHFFFLRAIAPILHQRGDVEVLITGDGTENFKKEMAALIHHLGITKQVHLVGTVDDMPAFYRRCDIICVPSSSESFGRTVIEAMASQKPLLASAVGGIKEIVDDRVNGLLFDYGDEEAFRSGLTELLDDKALREHLARAARMKAWQQYQEETYQQRLIAILEETLAGAK